MTTKVCSKCHKRKRIQYFQKQKDKPGGVHEHCKSCRNAYFKAHYAAMSPEKKAARNARMREYLRSWRHGKVTHTSAVAAPNEAVH